MVLLHTECFGHNMAPFICGVYSMDFWFQSEEMFEGFGGVSRHVNVYIFLVVIPGIGQSTVVLPFKFHGDFIIFFKIVQ